MESAAASRGQRIRKELFELYSSHLASFAEDQLHFEVRCDDGTSFFPPLGEFYLCPLCLGCFYRSALDEPLDVSPLTIEDVPPKSVARGIQRTKVLTCRSCNSKTGSQVESHLEAVMAWNDFEPGHVDSSRKCTLQTADAAVHAHLSIGSDRAFRFEIVGDAGPRGRGAFFENLREKLQFEMSMPRPDIQRSNAALLKSAYLLAFASFGYSYILSTPALEALKCKIMAPKSDSLFDHGVIPLMNELPGGLSSPSVSVVQEPAELRSLFVVLTLRRRGKTRVWGTFLPGPNTSDVSLYQALGDRDEVDTTIRATQIFPLPPASQTPIRDPASRHLIHHVWKALCE